MDSVLIHLSNQKKTGLEALSVTTTTSAKYPLPLSQLIRQVVSDRLWLAADHQRVADDMLFRLHFRSSISRHYYAMYHAGRAVVYANHGGDDYERHSTLARHLPPAMLNVLAHETELTNARLLRNQADYDPYPAARDDWESEARNLAAVSATFLQRCEDFALSNGYI